MSQTQIGRGKRAHPAALANATNKQILAAPRHVRMAHKENRHLRTESRAK